MSEEMTRRQFVKSAAVLGAGVALAVTTGCTGSTASPDDIATPSSTYGCARMGARVLVGYATRTGSTIGVAEAIAKTLAERGFAVDVKLLREKPVLAGYDAVVLGSAVNGGAWLPEAVSFVDANRNALGGLPVAAFCVHSMNLGEDEKARSRRLGYLDKIRDTLSPVDEGFFAGVGPSAEDSSFIARWAFKAFGGGAEGDCRDWDAIAAWARQAPIGAGVSS